MRERLSAEQCQNNPETMIGSSPNLVRADSSASGTTLRDEQKPRHSTIDFAGVCSRWAAFGLALDRNKRKTTDLIIAKVIRLESNL